MALQDVEFIRWVLVDTTQPGWNQNTISKIEAKHQAAWPENQLSVNENVAGDRALFKVSGTDPEWLSENQLDQLSALVLAIYDSTNHDDAKAVVNAPGWYPPAADA